MCLKKVSDKLCSVCYVSRHTQLHSVFIILFIIICILLVYCVLSSNMCISIVRHRCVYSSRYTHDRA